MKIIEKNILTVENGIICQQVNCQGAMNSGLAKQIREKWPVVYARYKEYCNQFTHDFELLGNFQEIDIIKGKLIINNIFGQLNFGYDGKRYTDYGALKQAFKEYKSLINRNSIRYYLDKLDIYFPFNFGCDRGGADWGIVSKMIDYYFPNAIICKFQPNKTFKNE